VERRSFLKILGLVTGGALIHAPAVREIMTGEWVPIRGISEAEFYFKLRPFDGLVQSIDRLIHAPYNVDLGPYIASVEPPEVELRRLDVTTFMDSEPRYIQPPTRASKLRLGFNDLSREQADGLIHLIHRDERIGFELGHRPTGWSWTGDAFLTEIERYPVPDAPDLVTCSFQPTGIPEVHYDNRAPKTQAWVLRGGKS
jgi:hypothetical protein